MLQLIIPVLVDKIFDQLAKSPVTPVERQDAPVTKPEIRDVVENELVPVLEHLTNNEPARKSKVTQGAIAVIVMACGTIAYAWSQDALTGELLFTQGAILLGAGRTLYGRWAARVPLSITK